MITVRKVINQDTQDILSDTELSTVPADGQIEIYGASSASDTLLMITKGENIVVKNRPIKQSESGVIDTISDEPIVLDVLLGEKVSIDIDFNTLGQATLLVVHRRLDELI